MLSVLEPVIVRKYVVGTKVILHDSSRHNHRCSLICRIPSSFAQHSCSSASSARDGYGIHISHPAGSAHRPGSIIRCLVWASTEIIKERRKKKELYSAQLCRLGGVIEQTKSNASIQFPAKYYHHYGFFTSGTYVQNKIKKRNHIPRSVSASRLPSNHVGTLRQVSLRQHSTHALRSALTCQYPS